MPPDDESGDDINEEVSTGENLDLELDMIQIKVKKKLNRKTGNQVTIATCVTEVMDIFWKYFEDVKIATFDENVEGDDCATKKDFMEQKEKKRNY